MTGLHPPERVADYTARGWWTPDTMDDLFRARVAERADALAVVDPANKLDLVGTEPLRLTWTELAAEVDRLATGLVRRGLGAGDVLAVQLPNTVELVAVYFAAWRLGVVVCPLPVQFRAYEQRGLTASAGAVGFVTTRRIGKRAHAVEAAEVLDIPVWTVDDRPDTGEGVRSHPVDPNDPVTLCWTSGTEGAPKGVPRCAYDWLAIGRGTAGSAQVSRGDVLLNPFPMVNMAGISGVFLPWLLTGAVLVQHHPFDLPTFLRQVMTERITYTVAPPALLSLLLAKPEILSDVDISSLRLIGSGAAPLPPDMVRGWQETHGIGVVNFFGSNEGTALVTSPVDVPDPVQRASYFPRYGVPGFTWTSPVADSTSLRLVDLRSGADITEPGVPGELRLKGPTVFAGYHGEPGKVPDPFDDKGYLRTGDVFEIAGQAGEFLRYVDRANDIVNRGGMNISAAELEGMLGAMPSIADVAVIGYPDPILTERVCAVVVPEAFATLTLDMVVAYLREAGVASFKLPERLEVVAELPRNPTGKVAKRELRARFA
ncbi:class I adenylate-forming enzyme family protein [Labedaea rhizosphaerae]|uniref:Acyl-CoA synthetase (AMP-forming)/AMP-acid ligase II n=1 Tax=Labedaea rhizosphaerae TaxID=598644 RepID=A0A4R6RVQ2_LABRH|nr:class I adenylate-forming enzyme family protein [Labedaea rhizosphaerae]TDP91013.1 acyl-CoA synthetase (AMP-forming)/AMP-acid ligase II [Labedaea rhizosphaerae]